MTVLLIPILQKYIVRWSEICIQSRKYKIKNTNFLNYNFIKFTLSDFKISKVYFSQFHTNINFLRLLGIYSIHELFEVTLNAVNTHSTAIQPKSHEQKWDPSGLGIHNPPNGQRLSSHSNSRENCSSPDPSKPSDQS